MIQINPNDYQGLLTIEGITVAGLLLIGNIYFAWRLHKTQEQLKQSEASRLEDFQRFTDKFEEIRKETYTWLNQFKEVFTHANRQ